MLREFVLTIEFIELISANRLNSLADVHDAQLIRLHITAMASLPVAR